MASTLILRSRLHQHIRRLCVCRILVILVVPLLLLGIGMTTLSSKHQSEHSMPAASSYARRRSELYDRLAADLDRGSPTFLDGGGTSQSLKLSDVFQIKDGKVEPVLTPAVPAVRAVVLHMDPTAARSIFQVLRDAVFRHFSEDAIWTQNPELYHFSMYHASHHTEPVPATKAETEAEATAIQAVASKLSPLRIALRRVVLTTTGSDRETGRLGG